MKIGGVDPKSLSTEDFLVLPRGESEIVFRAVGVQDYGPFNALCPEPSAPKIHKPKEGWVDNVEEPGYKEMMAIYQRRRLAWLIITSLEPSEIEWDVVDPDKPGTWTEWEQELKDSGLNQVECNRVQNLVFQVNCLDEDKLSEAREAFILGQRVVQSASSGQNTEQESSPSGEPVTE